MRHFTNIARSVSPGLAFSALLLLSACGGGGGASTSGGGTSGGGGSTGGGGGNNTPLHIETLSPTSIMPTNALASLLIFGQGFRGAQCYIDGVPMSSTLSQGTLYVQVPSSLFMQVGVHQVTVHDGDGTVSNTLPLTVYIPQNGPQVMEAIPAFDVGGGASNPSFITVADVNGDGLGDVIMPATGQGVQKSRWHALLGHRWATLFDFLPTKRSAWQHRRIPAQHGSPAVTLRPNGW